eukprot:jgi/Bigna1/73638/fgenesh1_pg.25_\
MRARLIASPKLAKACSACFRPKPAAMIRTITSSSSSDASGGWKLIQSAGAKREHRCSSLVAGVKTDCLGRTRTTTPPPGRMASRATRVVSLDQLRALLRRAPCGIRASSTFAPNRLPPPPDPEIYAPEEAEAFKMKVHGTTLKDDLKWLEDPSHFEAMMYMRAENRYWQMISRELRTDIDTFKREMAAAVPSADVPLPSTQAAGYSYFMHTDRPLPVYTRMRAGEEHEEVLIDQNRLATQYRFTQIGDVKASPNGRYVAFLMDTRGDESYSLYLIDCAQPYHERDEKGGRIVALHVTSFDWLGNDRLVFAQTKARMVILATRCTDEIIHNIEILSLSK